MTYADVAWDYWRAGWRGVLPLPPKSKVLTQRGVTGHQGRYPFAADIQTWIDHQGGGNICLRLPDDVIGIDVDCYDGKQGGESLAEMEQRLGPLPPTIMSTSRTDGSGIRMFASEAMPTWPGKVATDIEMVHRGHRYAVVWPSIHPKTDKTYEWVDQRTGEVLTEPPGPDSFPQLPAAWVEDLQSRANRVVTKDDEVSSESARAWLEQIRQGEPCPKVSATISTALAAMEEGSRHDTMVQASARLTGLAAWGHAGCSEALGQLREAFINQVTSESGGRIDENGAIAEWRRSLIGAISIQTIDHPTPATACGCPLDSFIHDPHNDFWDSRPALKHIRLFAQARMTSPWAVLGCVLVHVATSLPPHYVLPATIGTYASLNVYCGIVAASGGGKGAAEGAAGDAITGADFITAGVGSGEGILHQYVRRVKATKELPAGLEQHTQRVLFRASEVDTLGALHARQASTLLSEIRKMWMGEELSFAYVDLTKRLTVGQHKYRAGLIVGIQPARAGTLLNDTDGGTPQRFLWMPGQDPLMSHDTPEVPDPWRWEMPLMAPTFTRPDGLEPISVCPEAIETIRDAHVRRNQGDGDALDGHALMCRLKVAAALAALDQRLEVASEDWTLSAVVMEVSDQTRAGVVAESTKRETARAYSQGLLEGQRELAKQSVMSAEIQSRLSSWVVRKLAELGPTTVGALRKKAVSTDRSNVEAVLDLLVEASQVVTDGDHFWVEP